MLAIHPQTIPSGTDRLLKDTACAAMVDVSKSTWWAGVKSGKYPKPVKVAARATRWRLSDVQKLIAEL